MVMRLFLVYVLVEVAVIVALVSTVGLGWTLLVLLASYIGGLALGGSQLRRQIERLRTGVTAANAQGAVTDSALVGIGSGLVLVPGVASSVLGTLLLLPPTRAVGRPLVTAFAAKQASRRIPLFTVSTPTAPRYPAGDYIDGEVIDVVDVTDVEPAAVEHRPK
jgi:UPF0716 protein FxsA